MFRVRVICRVIMLLFAGKSMAQNAVGNFRVSKISVDSDGNEYAPVIQNGKLLFTSDNRERLGVYFSSTDSLSRLSGIFRADYLNDSTFSKPELVDNRLNRCYNSGPAWINQNGDRLYFSSNEKSSFFFVTSKKKSNLQLYESRLVKGNWSKRNKLPFCEKTHNCTHPYLNLTADTLYFASDRAGGFGGFDLYYVVRQNENWSAPVNLGSAVNSSKNELFPSFNRNCLVFSSDREDGFGKLDLYEFTGNQLLHKGFPFNTAQDDFGYISVDENRGYFSSNRAGNDEIYFYRELFPDFKDCEPYVKDPFCYTFFEEEADELDEELALEYVWSFGDGSTAKGKEARHCFAGYGEYLVELNIVDRTTSQVFFNQTTYPFAIERSKRLHIEGPDTIPATTEIGFTAENSGMDGYEITHFYWDLDNGKWRVSDSNRINLSVTEEGTHALTMGVIARAIDGSGQKKFCVTKSIVVQQGAKMPLAPEKTAVDSRESSVKTSGHEYTLFLGVSDTLVPVSSINNKDSLRVQPVGDSLYLYSMGTSNRKSDLLEDYRAAQEMGFSNSRVTELKDGSLVQKNQLIHTPVVEIEKILDNRIRKEQIITSFEVFYDFDVFALTSINQQKIKTLVLNHGSGTNKRILISSFTDVKGKSEYNLKLSQKRSLAVRDELLKNGFPATQIEMEYYGKRVPKDMEPLSDAKRRKSLIIVYEEN